LQSSIIEPLSERELEVLRLLAGGLSNREIAERLYLSLNTLKAHTANIYSKLGAHSRMQAVNRAKALGVLPLT
jgi:LuxR family maltose regulon positive regulatory protein